MKTKKAIKGKQGIDLSRQTPKLAMIPAGNIKPDSRRKNYPKIKREGVFEHNYKCLHCGLEFKLYSWEEFRHNERNVHCPECNTIGGMLHYQQTISTKKEFDIHDGEHEIFGNVIFFNMKELNL